MTGDLPSSVDAFEWVDDAVPRYDSFLIVEDHRDRDRDLAAEHDHVSYEALGESSHGEPLWAVTVGEGSRTALLLGAPHPNEPIGSVTVDFLLRELATNESLRASLDYEFVCVPVSDPDGTRRNEGWFDGPFTLSNYALNFYRPPPGRQVEATFPVDHEDYSFDDPIPATRAVADLIEAHRPEFVYSLHNTGFGGCYYVCSEPLNPLHGSLTSLPEEYGVPLDRGEPEFYGSEAYDDAVFHLTTFEDRYEGVQENEDVAPSDELIGGNAYDYAVRFDEDVVEFLVELPYFHDPRFGDGTNLDRTREAVIREGVESRRRLAADILAAVRPVSDLLPDTPMAREAEGAIRHFRELLDEKLDWAESAAEADEPATVAGEVSELYVKQYDLLLYVGMLLRSIDRAASAADPAAHERLVAAKAELDDLFHERIGHMREHLDYEAIPIWKLVAIQARAGLLCLAHRQTDAAE